MDPDKIIKTVFGEHGERIDFALAVPCKSQGFIWDAISAYEGVREDWWETILYLIMRLQKSEGWGYVYVIKGTHKGVERMKIGKANDIADRLKLFNVKIPFDIETVAAFFVPQAIVVERAMHVLMSEYRLSGEWFDISPSNLKKIKLTGLKYESQGWAACIERIINAHREHKTMPDSDYIDYLELLLAMNNIPFQRNGAISNE